VEAEKVDVVVAGAGFAGLACAHALAAAGLSAVVVERGENVGAKSVSGGRLYLDPVRPLLPGLLEAAPVERAVAAERLTAVSGKRSATMEFRADSLRQPTPRSVTVLPAPFLQWMGDKVSESGGLIIPRNRVSLVKEGGRVKGVEGPEATLLADVVVAADGALSFLAEEAGLRGPLQALDYAVGAKEVIELPAERIEERFGVGKGEGVSHLFMGGITKGLFGGGFLYTNRESVSLGIVVGVEDLAREGGESRIYDLLDAFKERPEIDPLVRGGRTVEYSAHVVPEGGLDVLPRLFGDGILLAGDAAGLAVNAGLTVRGMDFALASGALAAKAVLAARERKDFSAASLAQYERLLGETFVLQEMQNLRRMPSFLRNPRFFGKYPNRVLDLLEDLFVIGDRPKGPMGRRVRSWLWSMAGFRSMMDGWRALWI
jgi:electron transfer flavoprotein-quinone oxidoreductase